MAEATWGFAEGDPITAELTAVRRLGGGSAYEAYLAFDDTTYGPVVVKVVRPDQVDDARALRGLAREVDALATVNHPVVVRGLRHELAGPRPHVVLEQIDGPRLSSLVRRYGPLQELQYLPLAVELASALHYLAHLGWVHLDVKPSNIIMGAPARLIDLSIARPAADAVGSRRLGTDAYMSPEQWDPDAYGEPSPASDVWGLGATLFEAVAGHRAYRVPTEEPARLPDRVPSDVAKIVDACLSPRSGDRPLPREVAEALEPVLDGQPAVRLGGGLRTR
ncbi:protein kinase [Nocardioides sp. MAH-18]|uniref:non-specific serine/threonine protein kinase n=1 Tax=Nocardioides agri TaxID=2682843 RepID=A0A6L6XVX8_9ACTN|nr:MULTISPECIES: serine/threonine-protein kinase [unclassified Nocardioides]MBA2952173.1 serine/threonine protein kinase [Nocardioides sp. CGMCC 1.13656]MVQ51339.1 protein kinase [Nocardioides sp. MAH-18]